MHVCTNHHPCSELKESVLQILLKVIKRNQKTKYNNTGLILRSTQKKNLVVMTGNFPDCMFKKIILLQSKGFQFTAALLGTRILRESCTKPTPGTTGDSRTGWGRGKTDSDFMDLLTSSLIQDKTAKKKIYMEMKQSLVYLYTDYKS